MYPQFAFDTTWLEVSHVRASEIKNKIKFSNDLFNRWRWRWPNGSAMNTTEIDIFHLRLQQFFGRPAAEQLADRLVIRDRDRYKRMMCDE